MKTILITASLLLALITNTQAGEEQIPGLLDISVTIQTGHGQGSGVMFTRGDTTYVWTAAHVVESLRSTRSVIVNGSPKTVVEFKDANIVQEFKDSGRTIGDSRMFAKVIKYSDSTTGEDLALLQIRKSNFTTVSTKFYSGDIPKIGTPLYHVGSLMGQVGANSLTSGVLSQIGRVLALSADGTVFDQTTATAFPGSSGGGMFLQADGTYVGMLVRGAGEGFNFIVPVRRMRDWAKTAKIEWAMDQAVVMPTADELKKMVVEDDGTHFTNEKSAIAQPSDYQFLITE